MASLKRIGFEIGLSNVNEYDDGVATGTVTTQSATKVRSGAQSAKVDSTGSNTASYVTIRGPAPTLGVGYYCRCHFNFDQLPGSTVKILAGITEASGAIVSARLTSAGKLQLFNDVAGTQIGSDSTATVAIDSDTCAELYMLTASGSIDATELRLNGVRVAAASSLALSDSAAGRFRIGWVDAPGASKVVYLDDAGINDSTGSHHNSWCGWEEKVVLLRPISDSQDGTWTGGAGGTGDLSTAVDNTPPIGTASETDSTQIESIDDTGNNSTDEYRANMTTYSTAGITANDLITVIHSITDHGEDVTAGNKTGNQSILSNPAQGASDGFTFGDDAGALGTWSSNWSSKWGSAINYPSVTLGTSPVVAIRKTDSGTRVASVDFIGIYVEYLPGKALVFCSDGSDETQDLKHWDSTSGTVTSDTSQARTGTRSIKCDSTAGSVAAYVQKNTILQDAGNQITIAFRFTNFPTATDTPFLQLLTTGSLTVADVRVSSAGVLKIYDGVTQEGSNGSTLSLNTWYRLCLSYTIASASVNEFRLFKDGVSDISVTNASLVNVGADRIRVGWVVTPGLSLVVHVDDAAVFRNTTLTDTGNCAVTYKLPNAENVTSFDTAIGTARSASDWNNVDEQPLSETNGWQHAATTVVEESYGVENAATGEVNLTGLTLKGYCAWVWAKAGAADVGAKLIDQSYRKYISLTGSSAMFTSFSDSTAYPSDVAAIGMQSTGSGNDTFFYEGGLLIVYVPAAGAILRTTTDAPTTSENVVRVQASVRTVTDAPAASESMGRVFVGARETTDAPSTSDSAARVLAEVRDTTDAPTLSDAAVQSLAAVRSASEAPASSESADRLFVGARDTTDTPAISESATRVVLAVSGATDSPAFSESVTRSLVLVRTTDDAPTVSDSISTTFAGVRSANESAAVSELLARTFIGLRTVAESVSSSEVVEATKTIERSATDAIVSSEDVSRSFAGTRAAVDATSISDSATRTAIEIRATTDSLVVSDDASKSITEVRTAADSPATSDVAERAVFSIRTTMDSVASSDSLARIFVGSRAAVDSPALSDTASRGLSVYRTTSDALTSSEIVQASTGGTIVMRRTASPYGARAGSRQSYFRTAPRSDELDFAGWKWLLPVEEPAHFG